MNIEIKEKKYLKKGERYFSWPVRISFLILTHGAFFNNLQELFNSFEEEQEIPLQLKDWTFGDIICSVISDLHNSKELNYCDWNLIFCFFQKIKWLAKLFYYF